MARRRLGVIERKTETHAMHGHLWDAVNLFWLGQTGRFKDGRRNIGAMSKLTAHTALVFNAFWPRDHHGITNAAEMRRYLLTPFKWRVASPRPCCRVMRSHVRAAPFVEPAVRFDRFQLLICCERNAVERGHFVERARLGAFHARTVITEDVNDQCVVSETHVPNRFDHAADSVVRVLLVAGIDFHLVRIQFLHIGRGAVPHGERWITRCEFRVWGNHTELFLTRERLFA